MNEHSKNLLDVVGGMAVLTAWLGLLSQVMTIIATTLTAIWGAIRIYEWAKAKRASPHRATTPPPGE